MLQKRNSGLAGTLREQVTLQKRGPDVNGDPLGPWADQFVVPARVLARVGSNRVPARGVGEEIVNQRIEGIQPVEVTMRLNAATALIDTDWRLVWLGWNFDITAVAVDELASIVSLMAVRYRGGDLS